MSELTPEMRAELERGRDILVNSGCVKDGAIKVRLDMFDALLAAARKRDLLREEAESSRTFLHVTDQPPSGCSPVGWEMSVSSGDVERYCRARAAVDAAGAMGGGE